jgi:hypothetical protein
MVSKPAGIAQVTEPTVIEPVAVAVAGVSAVTSP